MKTELEKFIEENRQSFDDRIPGADVLSRIQQRMGHTEATPAKKGIVISFKTIRWVAAACVIVIAGIGIWWMNLDTTNAGQQILAGVKPQTKETREQETGKQVEETRAPGSSEQEPCINSGFCSN